MKARIFLLCILILSFISCKNSEEQTSTEPFDGRHVTLRIAPPSFSNNPTNAMPRKIYGDYSSEKYLITFNWNTNDTIWVGALDNDNQVVNSTRFTAETVDKNTGIATFSGELPQGSTNGYYKFAAGPTVLPKSQTYRKQGIYAGTMRFENESYKIDESTEIVPLYPAWSALVFNPAYTFTFIPFYDEFETPEGLDPETTATQFALKSLVVQIATIDSTYTITYAKESNNMVFKSLQGQVPTEPLILVIAPTEKCNSIIATYTHDISDGKNGTFGSTDSEFYEEDLSHDLQTTIIKTLNFEEGKEPEFEKQNAYVLDPSTVANITWTGTPIED